MSVEATWRPQMMIRPPLIRKLANMEAVMSNGVIEGKCWATEGGGGLAGYNITRDCEGCWCCLGREWSVGEGDDSK